MTLYLIPWPFVLVVLSAPLALAFLGYVAWQACRGRDDR
jgi:hypothetical protein